MNKDDSNYAKHLNCDDHFFNEDFVLLHNKQKSNGMEIFSIYLKKPLCEKRYLT